MELLGQLNGVDIYLSTKPRSGTFTIHPSDISMNCSDMECIKCPFDNAKQVCDVNNLVLENKQTLFKNHPELLI